VRRQRLGVHDVGWRPACGTVQHALQRAREAAIEELRGVARGVRRQDHGVEGQEEARGASFLTALPTLEDWLLVIERAG
jgi:hypothetical protein